MKSDFEPISDTHKDGELYELLSPAQMASREPTRGFWNEKAQRWEVHENGTTLLLGSWAFSHARKAP